LSVHSLPTRRSSDLARFTHNVAEALAVPIASVKTLTLGSHGDTMVPVPSRCTVNGTPLTDLLPADKIEELVVRTRNGGAEVVSLDRKSTRLNSSHVK